MILFPYNLLLPFFRSYGFQSLYNLSRIWRWGWVRGSEGRTVLKLIKKKRGTDVCPVENPSTKQNLFWLHNVSLNTRRQVFPKPHMSASLPEDCWRSLDPGSVLPLRSCGSLIAAAIRSINTSLLCLVNHHVVRPSPITWLLAWSEPSYLFIFNYISTSRYISVT